jgi:ribosomal protein L6P/L9E
MYNTFSYLYFFLFKFFFVYLERKNILSIGKLGSFKLKLNIFFYLYNYNSIFYLKYFLLNSITQNKKNSLNKILFQKFISLFIISLFIGFRGKFKIVGRGYKLHKKNNGLIFKLGYSHLIFKNLDFSLYLKKKEKKKLFFTLISLNSYLLSHYINIFKSYRLPNIYKRKGIFNNTKKVNFKLGKANMV